MVVGDMGYLVENFKTNHTTTCQCSYMNKSPLIQILAYVDYQATFRFNPGHFDMVNYGAYWEDFLYRCCSGVVYNRLGVKVDDMIQ